MAARKDGQGAARTARSEIGNAKSVLKARTAAGVRLPAPHEV